MTTEQPFRLIVVRHGQTPCNVENRWHGWENCGLTEAGLAQAAAVGRRLAGERVDAVYSSDLMRALQTARAIAGHHGLEPIVDRQLRERHAGRLEGLLAEEVAQVYPGWEHDRSSDFWGWMPPEGETFHQVLERILPVVERLRQRHPGETAVLVTHMGPVRVLVSHFTGHSLAWTYEQDFPSTGVTVFNFHGDDVQLETLNDAAHVS